MQQDKSSVEALRVSTASVALISRESQSGSRLWLAQWNSHWQAYNFISGHVEEGETFRECLMREIEEELGLHNESDYSLPDSPDSILEFDETSARTSSLTHYVLALFTVTLIGECALERIALNPRNRWLNESEIEAGVASDGKAVSDLMAKPR